MKKDRLSQVDFKQSSYQVKNSYIHRRIAGNDVLISIGNNIANFNGYIEFNESAAFLWDKMKEPCTIDELQDALENHFHISHIKAVEDVQEFLNELLDNEMIMVV